jgi:hypothetical protein
MYFLGKLGLRCGKPQYPDLTSENKNFITHDGLTDSVSNSERHLPPIHEFRNPGCLSIAHILPHI